MPTYHFHDLSPAQKAFVLRVESGLRNAGKDTAILSVLGDGSASPNGEKFAAVRNGYSFEVVYDFNQGWCYHTAVQLPSN